jgi:monothiol glutaredoxin
LEKKLAALVKENPVVLFMKGSPNMPQCGFSRQVAMVLSQNSVENYTYVDILKSNEVRSGMKKYSDWPTFPQLYVDGEFVGGCDIVSEMHRNGELAKVLAKYVDKKED